MQDYSIDPNALAAFGGIYAVIAIAAVVLLISGRWRLFAKAGEKGWKSIIPIYSDYVQWRIGWKKIGYWWLTMLLAFSAGGLAGASSAILASSRADGSAVILSWIAVCCAVAAVVIELIAVYKLMRAFGHGGGMFVLYLFLPEIALPVLGFGSSKWVGARD